MSTDRDPDAVEEDPPLPDTAGTAEEAPRRTEAGEAAAAATGTGEDPAAGPPEAGAAATAAGAAAPPSEAEVELAAQRELLEKIERRKAEKDGPIAAGAKLSGQAAHLLAAVRAMESGGAVDPALLASAVPAAPPEPGPQAPAAATSRNAPERSPATRAPAPGTVPAVRAVLAEGGAPEALAPRLAAVLGERAADALREDPWQLLSVPGVRPEQADGFARALLGAECGPEDERRAAALVGWLLEQAALRGHTAVESSSARGALAGYGVSGPDEALQHAVAGGTVLVFQDGLEEGTGEADGAPGGEGAAHDTEGTGDPESGGEAAGASVPVLLGLDRYALAEESLADGLARLVKTASAADWEEAAATAVPASAAELIRAAGGHGLVLHTGGEAARGEPVALARAARTLGARVMVATHSENGRDRLNAGNDGNDGNDENDGAVSVTGLLAGTEGPARLPDGTFAFDLLVVLDAPQLDVETAAMLVESLPDGSRLVLSGDPGVLWSAGAGRVFADLLAAQVCPRISSRTPDPGPIGELVSGIGIGELNQVEAPGKEVVIVPVRDAGEAVHRTVQLVAESVPRAFGVSAAQTQVITVGHGGAAGTRALNTALKQRLNPGPGRFGGFDPGDRIAYVPEPGRTVQGSVVSADVDGLRLDCDGRPVVVERERVESAVRHGWALTAHQAAGMRWPAAVVVLPGDAAQGLSRPWVYTAFSRGDRHLSVVHGVDQALPHAVAEIPSQERTTRLRPLLEGLLAPAARPE